MDRSNYEIFDDGVYCCDGDHERAEKCDYYKLSNEAIVGLLQDYRKESLSLQAENEQLRKGATRVTIGVDLGNNDTSCVAIMNGRVVAQVYEGEQATKILKALEKAMAETK